MPRKVSSERETMNILRLRNAVVSHQRPMAVYGQIIHPVVASPALELAISLVLLYLGPKGVRCEWERKGTFSTVSTSLTDDRFFSLTVILHAGHRMNHLGCSLDIKLYLARTSDYHYRLRHITHLNRSYCSSSHLLKY